MAGLLVLVTLEVLQPLALRRRTSMPLEILQPLALRRRTSIPLSLLGKPCIEYLPNVSLCFLYHMSSFCLDKW